MSDRRTNPAQKSSAAVAVTPVMLGLLPVVFLVTLVAPNVLTRFLLGLLPTAEPVRDWAVETWVCLLGLGLMLATASSELLRVLALWAVTANTNGHRRDRLQTQLLLGTLARILVCGATMMGVRSAMVAGPARTTVGAAILLGLLLGMTADALWLGLRRRDTAESSQSADPVAFPVPIEPVAFAESTPPETRQRETPSS